MTQLSKPTQSTQEQTKLTNVELISRFESDALAPDSFHHTDHVRLAFAYLRTHPPLQALEKFAAALRIFTTRRGKPDLYNETITYAYFFLIRERMERGGSADWGEFYRQNPDLFTPRNGLLNRYYTSEMLQSGFAREVFVLPDRNL
jgi:hypothetical protein